MEVDLDGEVIRQLGAGAFARVMCKGSRLDLRRFFNG